MEHCLYIKNDKAVIMDIIAPTYLQQCDQCAIFKHCKATLSENTSFHLQYYTKLTISLLTLKVHVKTHHVLNLYL